MPVCNENKLTKNLQIFNQKFTKQHFENDIIELSVKDKKIQKQKGELKMKNLVQNKITENLKEKSKMKKFISSILLFTIIGIPMSSSVFVKAGGPGDGDGNGASAAAQPMQPGNGDNNGAPAAAQPMQPVVDPQPVEDDVSDDLWLPLDFDPLSTDEPIEFLAWPDAALIPEPPAPHTPAAAIPAQPGEEVGYWKRRSDKLLGKFNYKESEAYGVIKERFGELINENLIDLVNQARKILWDSGEPWSGKELTAYHHDRKDLMYKYIQDNWGQIKPVLDYKTLEACKLIKSHFGHELRHEELISVISVIQQNWPVFQDLTEDEKRDISLLYQYIEKHIAEIAQILPHIPRNFFV